METYRGNVGDIYIPEFNGQDYVSGATSLRATLVKLADECYSAGFKVPSAGIEDDAILTQHIKDGEVTTAKLASGITIGVIVNDTYAQWRNNANDADLDAIKVNTSDLMQLSLKISELRLENNYWLTSRNQADGANINLIRLNASDLIEFGEEIALHNMQNNVYATGRNNADNANINVYRVNASDEIELGVNTTINGDLNIASGSDLNVTLGDILPGGDRANDLGSTSKAWDNVYADGVSFDDGTNTIANYEEGSFTPALTQSGVAPTTLTYSVQVGKYIQIGKAVHFTARMVISAFTIGPGTGTVSMNIPKMSENIANQLVTLPIHYAGVDLTGTTILGHITPNSITCYLDEVFDNTTNSGLPLSALAAGDTFTISGTYFV